MKSVSFQERSPLTMTKLQLDDLPLSQDRTPRLVPIRIVYRTDYAASILDGNDPPKTQKIFKISGSNYKFLEFKTELFTH